MTTAVYSVTRIDPTGWLIERTTHATITEAGVAAARFFAHRSGTVVLRAGDAALAVWHDGEPVVGTRGALFGIPAEVV